MVIGREVPVAAGSVDVLYISTRGYRVIFETKLWRNPGAKLEVVAQALDMALAFPKWDFDRLENRVKRYSAKFKDKRVGLRDLLDEEVSGS
jgi:hypothetical protein